MMIESRLRMVVRRGIYSLLLGFCFGGVAFAQNLDAPKFLRVNFQSFSATSDPVYGNSVVTEPGRPSPNYLLETSLRFPIKVKGKTKIIGKLDVDNEVMFGFWDEREQEIEDTHLFQNSLSLIGTHDINETWRFCQTFRVNSSSTKMLDTQTGSTSIGQVTHVEKHTSNHEWGIGIGLSYRQSRLTILPVIKYVGPAFGKWKLDIFLPAKVLLRKRVNDVTRLTAGLRGNSSNYLLTDNAIVSNTYTNSLYRRINISGVLGYDRQLTRWVGFSAEVGAILPYRNGLYTSDKDRLILHEFGKRVTPHINIGLFLSYPK